MSLIRWPAALIAILGLAANVPAQDRISVQQPVVGEVSVGTVVSVPDRGRMFLGGVSSAGATRREYGPLPWGTSTGRFASRRSLDVGVFIHDFEAMDAALLAEPVPGLPPRSRIQSSRAAAALRHLRQRDRRN